jgi:hypothetical protein
VAKVKAPPPSSRRSGSSSGCGGVGGGVGSPKFAAPSDGKNRAPRRSLNN